MNEIKNLFNLLDKIEKRRFFYLICLMIFSALLEFSGIALVLPFIKLAANQQDLSFLPASITSHVMDLNNTKLLLALGSIILLLILISTFVKILLSWREQSFAWSLSHRLSTQQQRILLGKPYSFFIKKNSAEILTTLIVETSNTVRGILIPIAQIITNSIIALLFLGLVIFLNPKFSVIFLVTSLVFGVLIIIVLKDKLRELGNRRVKLERARLMQLKESVAGIKTIKSSQKEQFFINKYWRVSEKYSKIKPIIETLNTLTKNTLDILLFGSVVLLVLGMIYFDKDVNAMLPTLTFYIFVGLKLLPSVQNIIKSVITIRFNLPSIGTVFTGLKTDSSTSTYVNSNDTYLFKDNLSLEDCFFSHKDENWILKDVSVEITKGQKIGIVGYSGSGKSTLVEILAGLLFPQRGILKMDGEVIDKSNRHILLNQIAFVPQDVFFFDDTLLNNITLTDNDDEVDNNKLNKILALLDLEEFVNSLPKQLETRVGEYGVRLSGGQKQRFGFARALYKDPEILILDESTSAMDYMTEKQLLQSLKKSMNQLTILKVAHRLKSVKEYDKIYLIDDGKMLAQGKFQEIINESNLFKDMVDAGNF